MQWHLITVPCRDVNETLRPETDISDFLSPRRERDRDLPKFSRDRDETETFDFGSEAETETFKTDTETLFEILGLNTSELYVSQDYHDDNQFNSRTYSLTT